MKTSYWIIGVIVTMVASLVIGFVTGQEIASQSHNAVASPDTLTSNEPSLKSSPVHTVQDNHTKLMSLSPLDDSHNKPHDDADFLSEIDNLLFLMTENPNQTSLSIRFYEILEGLSVAQLLSLGAVLDGKDETQRKILSQVIIGQLIEKAPEEALAFTQKYNPMPESPHYLTMVKSLIAEKMPELGFEYLNQLLMLNIEDISLSENSRLLNILAGSDLKRLVQILGKFKDLGIKLDDSFHGITYGLTTNQEHLNVFNELRQLNDMSVLTSVLVGWVKVSPTGVFDRLSEIEDDNERTELTKSAFHFWILNAPEMAANYKLENSINKVETVKDILRIWPDEKAADALLWLSSQNNIDTNRHKIDYLEELSYSNPAFVQSHLNEVSLNEDEKIDFHKRIYAGFQRKSSADAEQFLSTLPFRNKIIEDTPKTSTTSGDRINKINKAFRRYYDYKYEKAFALSIDDKGAYAYSFVVNKASQSEANEIAIHRCEQRRHKYNVDNRCKIYAEGDVTLFDLIP